jgi:histidinol-phosphate phosphatase family protein
MQPPTIDIVVPTIGRPSLDRLLASLARTISGSERPPRVLVVDDSRSESIRPEPTAYSAFEVMVLRSGGRGPAAARNVGWRASTADWIAFLDDDVLVGTDWWPTLLTDLSFAGSLVGGVQGRITVPLPRDRRPTDFERTTAGLQTARWITADLAYRRAVLAKVGGFDERFPAAFREDSDLALRVLDAGYQLQRGSRGTLHPVRPADRWVSVRQQRGNADDVLMARLHGRQWRARAGAPVGRLPQHVVTTAALIAAVAGVVMRSRRLAGAAVLLWLANWLEFSARRIMPGPRQSAEVVTMLATSAAIPPVACWHRLRGWWQHRSVRAARLPAAVLLDRDGTLVHDVPYNGDPNAVTPMDGARQALGRLRQAGIPLAVVSNQSGIGRGLLQPQQVSAVNARIEELLGPFDGWFVCPHTERDGCNCRKPGPGLVLDAARWLGVQPEHCVLIGDIGSDLEAAAAAGARGILVPTEQTRPEEIEAAGTRASTLGDAVALILGSNAGRSSG